MSIEVDEVEETPIEDEPVEAPEDLRLKKMVDMLIKQVGSEVKGLVGKNLEEQFDFLSFLIDNKPKPVKRKAPNAPIVGKPTSQDKKQLGNVVYKNGSTLKMTFNPKKVFNGEYF